MFLDERAKSCPLKPKDACDQRICDLSHKTRAQQPIKSPLFLNDVIIHFCSYLFILNITCKPVKQQKLKCECVDKELSFTLFNKQSIKMSFFLCFLLLYLHFCAWSCMQRYINITCYQKQLFEAIEKLIFNLSRRWKLKGYFTNLVMHFHKLGVLARDRLSK